MAQPCKAAMAARVGLGHLLDNFDDLRWPSLLSPRFCRVPVDGCRRIFAARLLIPRSNPSPKRARTATKMGRDGPPGPAGPGAFWPISRPSFVSGLLLQLWASVFSIVWPFDVFICVNSYDVLSSKLLYLPSESPEFCAFTLWSLGHLESCSPRVLTCSGLHDLLTKCSLNFSQKCSF
jgi:hypothetical protein